MFYDLIKELESEGHEIIITTRPLANTIQLLNQKNLKHTVVGKHYGKNFLYKLFGFPVRIIQLVLFLKKKKLDLAVSQSSFHSPLTAKILGIPSLYTNDNEHALGNKVGFYFATKILVPEYFDLPKYLTSKNIRNKTVKYPGLKEGMYLWNYSNEINEYRKKKFSNKLKIYFRPEPQTAEYYNAKTNFLDDTIVSLIQNKSYDVTIFPRDSKQLHHYKQNKFTNIHVSEIPVSLKEIASTCDVFIGAGGSMTRELSILGIPTISVYQSNLLDVDKYLIQNKLMIHEPELNYEKLEKYLLIPNNINSASSEIIEKGKIAYSFFKDQILKTKIA